MSSYFRLHKCCCSTDKLFNTKKHNIYTHKEAVLACKWVCDGRITTSLLWVIRTASTVSTPVLITSRMVRVASVCSKHWTITSRTDMLQCTSLHELDIYNWSFNKAVSTNSRCFMQNTAQKEICITENTLNDLLSF